MSEKYVSLHDVLTKENEWAIMEGMKSATSAQDYLLGILFKHVEAFDDEGIIRLFGYVTKCIEDSLLLPLVEEKTQMLDPRKWEEVKRAKQSFYLQLATEAMSIFPSLPVFKPVKCYYWEDDDRNVRRNYVRQFRTLTTTKEKMFSVVGQGWKCAGTEEEADKFLEFLLSVKLHEEDEQMRGAVLRKITDSDFDIGRLAHAISHFGHKNPELMKILAHAWIKYLPNKMLANMFTVLGPLGTIEKLKEEWGYERHPSNVFRQLKSYAEMMRSLDIEAQAIVRNLGGKWDILHHFEQGVPYVSLVYDKTAFHGRPPDFDRLREEVRDFLSDHPHYNLKKVHLMVEYKNPQGEVLFRNEDMISIPLSR